MSSPLPASCHQPSFPASGLPFFQAFNFLPPTSDLLLPTSPAPVSKPDSFCIGNELLRIVIGL